MNCSHVNPLVRALLYEGAVLYPYRPSLKNVHRWTFGCLLPPAYPAARPGGADNSEMVTECLVHGTAATRVEAVVRFLRIIERRVERFAEPSASDASGAPRLHDAVDLLTAAGQSYRPWQEVEEVEIPLRAITLDDLAVSKESALYTLDERRWQEPIGWCEGRPAGLFVRAQSALRIRISRSVTPLHNGLFRLRVSIANETHVDQCASRDTALLSSCISTHTLLQASDGSFFSLTDPPAEALSEAGNCHNVGTWPVLVGSEESSDVLLSSPIILSDHPQIAPESPGDFGDATEIDEMLTLRVMTLTDSEKREMMGLDDFTRRLIHRTQSQTAGQVAVLHGKIRDIQAAKPVKS